MGFWDEVDRAFKGNAVSRLFDGLWDSVQSSRHNSSHGLKLAYGGLALGILCLTGSSALIPAQTIKTVLEQLLLMSGWLMGSIIGTLSAVTVTFTTSQQKERYLGILAILSNGLLLYTPIAFGNHPPAN